MSETRNNDPDAHYHEYFERYYGPHLYELIQFLLHPSPQPHLDNYLKSVLNLYNYDSIETSPVLPFTLLTEEERCRGREGLREQDVPDSAFFYLQKKGHDSVYSNPKSAHALITAITHYVTLLVDPNILRTETEMSVLIQFMAKSRQQNGKQLESLRSNTKMLSNRRQADHPVFPAPEIDIADSILSQNELDAHIATLTTSKEHLIPSFKLLLSFFLQPEPTISFTARIDKVNEYLQDFCLESIDLLNDVVLLQQIFFANSSPQKQQISAPKLVYHLLFKSPGYCLALFDTLPYSHNNIDDAESPTKPFLPLQETVQDEVKVDGVERHSILPGMIHPISSEWNPNETPQQSLQQQIPPTLTTTTMMATLVPSIRTTSPIPLPQSRQLHLDLIEKSFICHDYTLLRYLYSIGINFDHYYKHFPHLVSLLKPFLKPFYYLDQLDLYFNALETYIGSFHHTIIPPTEDAIVKWVCISGSVKILGFWLYFDYPRMVQNLKSNKAAWLHAIVNDITSGPFGFGSEVSAEVRRSVIELMLKIPIVKAGLFKRSLKVSIANQTTFFKDFIFSRSSFQSALMRGDNTALDLLDQAIQDLTTSDFLPHIQRERNFHLTLFDFAQYFTNTFQICAGQGAQCAQASLKYILSLPKVGLGSGQAYNAFTNTLPNLKNYKNLKNFKNHLNYLNYPKNPSQFKDFLANPLVQTHYKSQFSMNTSLQHPFDPNKMISFELFRSTTRAEKNVFTGLANWVSLNYQGIGGTFTPTNISHLTHFPCKYAFLSLKYGFIPAPRFYLVIPVVFGILARLSQFFTENSENGALSLLKALFSFKTKYPVNLNLKLKLPERKGPGVFQTDGETDDIKTTNFKKIKMAFKMPNSSHFVTVPFSLTPLQFVIMIPFMCSPSIPEWKLKDYCESCDVYAKITESLINYYIQSLLDGDADKVHRPTTSTLHVIYRPHRGVKWI